MTIGYTAFSEYTDGQFPSDWVNALGQGDDFTKLSGSGGFIDDARLEKDSNSNFSVAGWGPSAGSSTTIEIAARVIIRSSISVDKITLHVNQVVGGAGGDGFPDLFAQLLPGTPGTLNIVHNVTQITGSGLSITISLDTFYWVRFRWEVANALVFGKVWAIQGSEPASWDIDGFSYSDPGDRGPIGFGGDWYNVSLVDVVGFATDGETAPLEPIPLPKPPLADKYPMNLRVKRSSYLGF